MKGKKRNKKFGVVCEMCHDYNEENSTFKMIHEKTWYLLSILELKKKQLSITWFDY